MTEQSDKPSVDGLCKLAKARERAYYAWKIGRGRDDAPDDLFDAYHSAKNELRAYAERLAALAGPLEQPQEPDSSYSTSRVGQINKTALPVRSAKDYAIEHAEYMAKDAERFIAAVNDLALAEQEQEDGTANESDVDAARETLSEATRSLNSGIYEFRKRKDRAACEASAGSARSDEKASAPESSVSVPKEQQ